MKTCSFFGHRNTEQTEQLYTLLKKTIINLIEKHGVSTFLFGSKSSFDDLCLKAVTELKTEYPQIKSIYYRASFQYISPQYKDYLLKSYEDTLMPLRVEKAGKASYVERNQAMIDQSDFCVFYFNENYIPPLKRQSKNAVIMRASTSGTMRAYEYAVNKKRTIINLFKSV